MSRDLLHAMCMAGADVCAGDFDVSTNLMKRYPDAVALAEDTGIPHDTILSMFGSYGKDGMRLGQVFMLHLIFASLSYSDLSNLSSIHPVLTTFHQYQPPNRTPPPNRSASP